MNLLVAGINHRAAPVEVRERIAFSADAVRPALERLRSDLGLREGVILSTCNRVEVYGAFDGADVRAERVATFLENFHGLSSGTTSPYLYAYQGLDVARHLFRVASALDSMVVGETQILGQVRDAYQIAASHGATGKILNALFQNALKVGKEVQSTTQITSGHTSMAAVAVDFARRIFRDLAGLNVLVVGAGEMGETVLRHLQSERIGRIVIANRSIERARDVASRYSGEAMGIDRLEKTIGESDIVLACAGGDSFLIGVEMVEAALHARRKRPIYFVDIAVPRSIEPAVHELDNAYLYDVDDFEEVVTRNVESRAQEVVRCETIVDHAVRQFGRELHVFAVDPLVSDMAKEFERIRQAELERVLQKLPHLGDADRAEVEALTQRLTGKLLHRPLQNLKHGSLDDDGGDLVRALQKLFEVRE
ncbi:MAG: glutamyl-tRNA reductase [Planctomycetes bacterium]|nr:glutamyl-tRNA reductase [Planctomycetota bacterium]MBI3848014.1 glutamyl-tRNA reductase [Planctomycetota bacterium]